MSETLAAVCIVGIIGLCVVAALAIVFGARLWVKLTSGTFEGKVNGEDQ